MEKEFKKLKKILTDILVEAPEENNCTEEENRVYINIQELQKSIVKYLEK